MRAETWLATQHKDNVYLRYNRYTGAALTPSQSSYSLEITGYAAHYWAWRCIAASQTDFRHKTLCKGAADAIIRTWQESGGWLPFEPGSDQQYFFDCGIAARGLQAAARCLESRLCLDVAAQITAAMRAMEVAGQPGRYRPTVPIGVDSSNAPAADLQPGAHETIWWSQGPFAHNRKAALAFRLATDKASFDSLDLYTRRLGFGDYRPPPPTPAEVPFEQFESERKAAKKNKSRFEKQGEGYAWAPWHVELQRADYNHPLAYILEASAMSDIHQSRAEAEAIALEERIKGTPNVRSDSYAQLLRAKMYLSNGMIPIELFDRLIQMQHTSGGFRFSEASDAYRPTDVSVHATIFAAQALGMGLLYNDRKITDLKAPFGRQELAIV